MGIKKPVNNNALLRINFNIPKNTIERFDDIAKLKGMTRTQLLIFVINQYIDQRDVMEYMPRVIEMMKKEQEKEVEKLLN